MLAGQYVVHDGRTYQLSATQTTAVTGRGGLPIPAVSYRLLDLETTTYTWVVQELRGPDAGVELAPGCETCQRRPGFARCAFDGAHQGPTPATVGTRPADLARFARGCSCGSWACGECGHRMADGTVAPTNRDRVASR